MQKKTLISTFVQEKSTSCDIRVFSKNKNFLVPSDKFRINIKNDFPKTGLDLSTFKGAAGDLKFSMQNAIERTTKIGKSLPRRVINLFSKNCIVRLGCLGYKTVFQH